MLFRWTWKKDGRLRRSPLLRIEAGADPKSYDVIRVTRNVADTKRAATNYRRTHPTATTLDVITGVSTASPCRAVNGRPDVIVMP
jgi:hypothetical protein